MNEKIIFLWWDIRRFLRKLNPLRHFRYRRWKWVQVTIYDGEVEVIVSDGEDHRVMIKDYYGGDGCVVDHSANLLYWKEKQRPEWLNDGAE